MQFTLTIELGNEAMRTYADIRKALEYARKTMVPDSPAMYSSHGRAWRPQPGEGTGILDMNGNTVGKWEVVDDTPMDDEQVTAMLVESRRQARIAAAYKGGTWYVVQAGPQRVYEVAADFYEPARDRAIVARFDKLAMGTEEVYDARKVQKLAEVGGVPRWTPTLYQTLAEARKAEPGEAFRRRPSRRPRRDPDHPDTPSLEDRGQHLGSYGS